MKGRIIMGIPSSPNATPIRLRICRCWKSFMIMPSFRNDCTTSLSSVAPIISPRVVKTRYIHFKDWLVGYTDVILCDNNNEIINQICIDFSGENDRKLPLATAKLRWSKLSVGLSAITERMSVFYPSPYLCVFPYKDNNVYTDLWGFWQPLFHVWDDHSHCWQDCHLVRVVPHTHIQTDL